MREIAFIKTTPQTIGRGRGPITSIFLARGSERLRPRLNDVAAKVESACRDCQGRNLSDVTASVVHAYMSAKTCNVEESQALYQVFAELNATELVAHAGNRINSAITGALASVRAAHFDDLPTAVFMLRGAMSGVTRSLFEHSALLHRSGDTLNEQTTLLCMAYLRALADRVVSQP